MRKSYVIIIIFFMLLIYSCHRSVYVKEIKKRNYKIPGQTVPNDMIFIPENGRMPSFYISVSEEPNINYVIYLKWLIHVYVDYPKVIIEAIPKNPGDIVIKDINDPYLKYYLTNPKFAYYPVVNLTWKQIQNYLAWKTDRLNEMILVKTGTLYFQPNQINAKNFNTEAYLLGQYDGHKRQGRVNLHDGILFTGFRLPTEAEWEYASQFQIPNAKLKKEFKRKTLYHPYGEDYYTLLWGNYFSKYDKEYYGDRYNNSRFAEESLGFKSYEVNPSNYEPASYQFKKKNYDLDTLFKTILDYPTSSYGLINMHGGVKEWVLDVYHDTIDKTNNWLKIMEAGGFNISTTVKKSPDGYLFSKDSLGKMQNFRFIGFDSNGKPRCISHTTDNEIRKRVVKGGSWEAPGNYRQSLEENKSSPQIGFRCVLPYTGAPVLKGYKVKWGQKIRSKN